MTITTHYEPTMWGPSWSAYDDVFAGEETAIIGRGDTEQEARDDFAERLRDAREAWITWQDDKAHAMREREWERGQE